MEFPKSSLDAALDRALASAEHLGERDAATVAAARALARKIDAWDVIVGWALEDAAESGGRPAVPQNDNVSLASFLKYMDALQLVPPAAGAGPKVKPVGGVAKGSGSSELDKWRAKSA
ncbi:hypothetical protein U6G28_02575 [Actinomycetaceae bacterium MB13-C1-2]|nr:hypothetical protein U6G28_02575 [Actinomycetaceae bacterium MB13-C1-2]